MVTFGSYSLRHVLDVRIQESRSIIEHLIPGARIGYRADETAGGRIITVTGEVRGDPDYALRLEELRVRADDVARALDLEDGSAAINAKLGSVKHELTAEDWSPTNPPVPYSVTFHETRSA